jgi:hypothetical protein
VRAALNRLLGIVLLGALVLFAAWVAIEAVARLLGRATHLLPVDYRSWWHTMQDWNPTDVTLTAIFVGVGVLGLILLACELWPRRGPRTVEVARAKQGRVLLRARFITPYLRARLQERSWVRSASPRVRLRGTTAELSDRPRAARPWDPEELQAADAGLREDLRRLGLEAGSVRLAPRAPAGRGTRQVR